METKIYAEKIQFMRLSAVSMGICNTTNELENYTRGAIEALYVFGEISRGRSTNWIRILGLDVNYV